MKFVKAVRKQAKLRLALTGPSGSGKTYGALMLAKGLGGRIAVVDTERGSASLYSHLAEFDVLELEPPYSPERYIQAIKAAEAAGYDVIVIDSTTHEWSGSGGCLEINEHTAQAKFRGNTWSAWNDTTPRHRAFIDAMLQLDAHIIATGRSKTETAQTEDGGRKKVVKLGMKTEQRDGFEYEFTCVLDITHAGHFATASKDRTGLFAGDVQPISEDTGRTLRAWLESGAEPTPAQVADETLTAARKEELEEMALCAVDEFNKGNHLAAAAIYGELTDNEEKLYLWGLLREESKLRSFIKANGPKKAA